MSETPDEPAGAETLAILRLLLRGYVFALIGGTIWHWPFGSAWLEFPAAMVAGLLVYVSCLPLMVAGAAIRNLLARRMSLQGRPRVAIALGLAILLALLVLGALVFGLGQKFVPG